MEGATYIDMYSWTHSRRHGVWSGHPGRTEWEHSFLPYGEGC